MGMVIGQMQEKNKNKKWVMVVMVGMKDRLIKGKVIVVA